MERLTGLARRSCLSANIIVLNGTSSAGKTTLAKAIQGAAREPYHLIAFDQFRDGLPDRFRGLNSPIGSPGAAGLNVVAAPANGAVKTFINLGTHGLAMLRGMHTAIASFACAGHHVVVDHFVNHPRAAANLLETLQALSPVLVGVLCDSAELMRREQLRPGRFPGTAETQREIMSTCFQYDLTVDSTHTSAHILAQQVLAFVENRPETHS